MREQRETEEIQQNRPIDNCRICDKLRKLNVLTKLRMIRRQEREGTVRALGDPVIRATSERTVTSGTANPRYRIQ